jgi:hypothetical protein
MNSRKNVLLLHNQEYVLIFGARLKGIKYLRGLFLRFYFSKENFNQFIHDLSKTSLTANVAVLP